MKRFYQFFNNLHSSINENFKLPPLVSVTLLTLYIVFAALIAYLIGYDLISWHVTSVTDNFTVTFIRTVILILFINFNIIYLYLLVRRFKHRKIPLRVIYSYYAVFSTFLFIVSLILFFSILFSYYVLNMQLDHITLTFGVAILIILTSANLYPAYFLFLSLKDEPVDVFWAIILCVVGIHIFSYLLFTIWNRLHIIQLWL